MSLVFERAASLSFVVFPSKLPKAMVTAEVLNIRRELYKSKTKEVYELLGNPRRVLLWFQSQIIVGNAARMNHLEGKTSNSNKITNCIFQLL